MKIKPFWTILVIIVLIWIGNYLYAEKHKLDQPIFLNHYLDIDLTHESYIPLYFITNKGDTSFIQTVELGNVRGMPDQFVGHNGVEEIEQFGRYSLKRVNVQFHPEAYVTPEELLKFTEMTVYFSEHHTTDYPIGQITFRTDKERLDPLEFRSGSAGEYTETRLNAIDALSIKSVSTTFDDVLQGRFHIKLQSATSDEIEQPEPVIENDEWDKAKGTDIREMKLPLHLDRNDWLTVKSYVDPSLHAIMDVKIYLEGTTEAGQPFTGQVGHLQYEPYFTKESIQEMIDERMEVEDHE